MGYTLYKRLRRLLFRLKKESTLLRENDAPCIHCIKSNASLSKYSQPIKEHGNFVFNQTAHSRNEDFISSDEEKRLKHIVTSLEGLSEKTTSCTPPLLMDRNIAILNLLIDYGLSLQELTALTMHHVHFETNTLSIPATAESRKNNYFN